MVFPTLFDMLIAFAVIMFVVKVVWRFAEPADGGSESFISTKEKIKRLNLISYLMAVLPLLYVLYRQFTNDPVCWSAYGWLCT